MVCCSSLAPGLALCDMQVRLATGVEQNCMGIPHAGDYAGTFVCGVCGGGIMNGGIICDAVGRSEVDS